MPDLRGRVEGGGGPAGATETRSGGPLPEPAAALPLSELLPRIVTPGGALVVISGLDYDSLRLTPQSQIRKL